MKYSLCAMPAIAAAVSIFYIGCGKNNPSTGQSPFGNLATELPAQGDTLHSDTLSFSSPTEDIQINYAINGSEWSGWVAPNLVAELLDDGPNTIIVQARTLDSSQTYCDTIAFYVDALPSPSVVIFPRRLVTISDSATVQIFIKGISDLRLISSRITGVEVVSAGKLITGDNAIFLSDINQDSSLIDLAIGPGVPAVTGPMNIISLVIKTGIAGDTSAIQLTVDNIKTAAADGSNQAVTLALTRGATIIRR